MIPRLKHATCLAAAALWLQPAAALAGERLRLLVSHWCPFVCTERADQKGYATDVVLEVFGRHGIAVSLGSGMSYPRGLAMVETGQADGIIGTSHEDAPRLVFPDAELGYSSNTIFVRADNPWRYTEPASLAQLQQVGTVQGYEYPELSAIFALTPEKIQALPGQDIVRRSIGKLLAGRLDAFIYDAVVTEFELRNMGKSKAVVTAGSLPGSQAVYVAFSPKLSGASRYAALLSRGTRELRASGALAAILARYGVEDWRAP